MAIIHLETLVLRGALLREELVAGLRLGTSWADATAPAIGHSNQPPVSGCRKSNPRTPPPAMDTVVGAVPGAGRLLVGGLLPGHQSLAFGPYRAD